MRSPGSSLTSARSARHWRRRIVRCSSPFFSPARRAERMPRFLRERMLVSPRWMQAILVTFLFGFAILGYLAIRVYEEHPPVPGSVVSKTGQVLFTGDDI